jgi:hypothetical protein
MTQIPKKISPDLKNLLSGFFHDFSVPNVIRFQDRNSPRALNLDQINFHDGLPWISRFATIKPGAMTLGFNIYFANRREFNVMTIVHELVHTEQYTRFVALNVLSGSPLTLAGFVTAYLGASGVAIVSGDLSGYHKNRFEKQAREKSRRLFSEVKRRWELNDCGIPLGDVDGP